MDCSQPEFEREHHAYAIAMEHPEFTNTVRSHLHIPVDAYNKKINLHPFNASLANDSIDLTAFVTYLCDFTKLVKPILDLNSVLIDTNGTQFIANINTLFSTAKQMANAGIKKFYYAKEENINKVVYLLVSTGNIANNTPILITYGFTYWLKYIAMGSLYRTRNITTCYGVTDENVIFLAQELFFTESELIPKNVVGELIPHNGAASIQLMKGPRAFMAPPRMQDTVTALVAAHDVDGLFRLCVHTMERRTRWFNRTGNALLRLNVQLRLIDEYIICCHAANTDINDTKCIATVENAMKIVLN